MFLENPLLRCFLFICFSILIKIFPLIILILVVYCLFRIDNIKNKEYSFKIFDFDFNGFCICIYLFIYVFIIFWYKLSYTSKTTDLNPFINDIKEYYNTNNFFIIINDSIFLLLVLICFLYVIKIIHKFFRKELKKRFIVLQIIYHEIDLRPYLFYIIPQKVDLLLTKTLNKYNHKFSKNINNYIFKMLLRLNEFFFYKSPLIFLVIFLFYELLFNDCILTPLFYKYLLFYFFYYNYKNISFFCGETDYGINKILFSMYYRQKTIKYMNIPQDYQNLIMRYILLDLQRNIIKNPEPLLDNVLGEFDSVMCSECQFFLVETLVVETIKKDHYRNYGGYSFFDNSEENNYQDIIIHDFYFTKKIYKFLRKLFFGTQNNNKNLEENLLNVTKEKKELDKKNKDVSEIKNTHE